VPTANRTTISLEELTASIPGVVYQFLVQPNGTSRFTFISRGIEQLFEVNADDGYQDSDNLNSCIVAEDLPAHHRSIAEAVSSLQPWHHEYRIITARTRQIRWIRGNALPRPLDDGGILWHGILTDISDYMQLKLWQQQQTDQLAQDLQRQKQARQELQQQWDRLQELIEARNHQLRETEQTLKNSQNFLDKIINSMADPLFIKDRNHRYLMVNDAACSLAGHHRNILIGKDDFDLFPHQTAAEVWKHDTFVQQSGRGCSYELQLAGPDGRQLTVLVRKTLYVDPQGERFTVGILRDISERIEAEQQKSCYAQHLVAAIEQERTRLARELHDVLGAALTEQSFGIKQLKRSLKTAMPHASHQLEQLQNGIQGMATTVQRLCTSLRPSLLDELGLKAAVEWLAGECSRTSGISCEITWHNSDLNSPDSATELFRIVQESLNNIMKHADADLVTISFVESGQDCLLEISDNGCGFDPLADRSRLSFGIIGMQERAAAIGGSLEIISTPGQGTTLRLTLPCHTRRNRCVS